MTYLAKNKALFLCLNLHDELPLAGRLHSLVTYMPLILRSIRTGGLAVIYTHIRSPWIRRRHAPEGKFNEDSYS